MNIQMMMTEAIYKAKAKGWAFESGRNYQD